MTALKQSTIFDFMERDEYHHYLMTIDNTMIGNMFPTGDYWYEMLIKQKTKIENVDWYKEKYGTAKLIIKKWKEEE